MRFYKKYWKLLREIFLYGIIGVFSASVDTMAFFVMNRTGLTLLVANFTSVNIGIGISFFLNTYLNFRKTSEIKRRAWKFFTIGYAGLLLSMGIMWIGVYMLAYEKMIVKTASVIITAGIQYILNKFITFKDSF